MEFGMIAAPRPGRSAGQAQRMEALGFDTILFTDSQNLAPDVWGQLCVAAGATQRIKLGTGVTNSITRDAAVTASAALGLHAESAGRAMLGIGRGDSAVQRIGKDLDPVASFERYIERLQGYLRGDSVDRDGFASALEWHRAVKHPKVPLQIAATGPRVIELAGRHADGVMLAVGADPEHLQRCRERFFAAARAAGRDVGSLRCGAFINTLVADDLDKARDAVRGTAATFARFSSFKGSPVETLPPRLQQAVAHVREHYDMSSHTSSQADHARGIDDEFVDWFAIVGPADAAIQRFAALRDIGLDFVYLVSGSHDSDRDVARNSIAQISEKIIPAMR